MELGFWNEGVVKNFITEETTRSYGLGGDDEKRKILLRTERTTAKFLKIELTDKPQEWGVRLDSPFTGDPLYSYGQSYDSKTQTVTIVVHLNPSYHSSSPQNQRFSGAVLAALSDITAPDISDGNSDYKYKRSLFFKDFYKNPEQNSFLKIN